MPTWFVEAFIHGEPGHPHRDNVGAVAPETVPADAVGLSDDFSVVQDSVGGLRHNGVGVKILDVGRCSHAAELLKSAWNEFLCDVLKIHIMSLSLSRFKHIEKRGGDHVISVVLLWVFWDGFRFRSRVINEPRFVSA